MAQRAFLCRRFRPPNVPLPFLHSGCDFRLSPSAIASMAALSCSPPATAAQLTCLEFIRISLGVLYVAAEPAACWAGPGRAHCTGSEPIVPRIVDDVLGEQECFTISRAASPLHAHRTQPPPRPALPRPSPPQSSHAMLPRIDFQSRSAALETVISHDNGTDNNALPRMKSVIGMAGEFSPSTPRPLMPPPPLSTSPSPSNPVASRAVTTTVPPAH